MDSLAATHVAGRDGWPGVARGGLVSAAAVLISWHTPEVAKYALAVIALVASPALARAVIAPRLARLLKD